MSIINCDEPRFDHVVHFWTTANHHESPRFTYQTMRHDMSIRPLCLFLNLTHAIEPYHWFSEGGRKIREKNFKSNLLGLGVEISGKFLHQRNQHELKYLLSSYTRTFIISKKKVIRAFIINLLHSTNRMRHQGLLHE